MVGILKNVCSDTGLSPSQSSFLCQRHSTNTHHFYIHLSSDDPRIMLGTDCSCSGASPCSLFLSFLECTYAALHSLMIPVMWWGKRF